MNTDNITKGEAKVFNIELSDYSMCGVGVLKEPAICHMHYEGIKIPEYVKSNAELICEAFNVAQETGLSPIQMKERIKELEDALQIARSTIKVWHGDVAWDLYQISPEMKMINNALNPKTEKCKCEFPLVRNDGKEYCGTCNKDI